MEHKICIGSNLLSLGEARTRIYFVLAMLTFMHYCYLVIIFCGHIQNFQKLGFASCKRNAAATEGINVLIEKKNLEGKWTYGISCIEYTEFDKFGMTDNPFSSYRYSMSFLFKFKCKE